jgi:hypothetical protein
MKDKSREMEPTQAAKFKAMAKEVEAADDESTFDVKLKALATSVEKPSKIKAKR